MITLIIQKQNENGRVSFASLLCPVVAQRVEVAHDLVSISAVIRVEGEYPVKTAPAF